MLKRAIRSFVVAVVSLAVPVQGIGAVTAGQCMSLEHHDAIVAASERGAGAHAAASPVGEAHSHGDVGVAKVDVDAGSGHCGPCSACCASTSISGPMSTTGLPVPAALSFAFSQFLPAGVRPGELDRPPLGF